ncbi:hypothetical protein [Clostridium felsineum]|uniref:hypothetical protein n=1 Tax=Clostridium felsineum TaxID=36839 RepID=UPI00098CBD23|nr:hypothetical protein [Clostridium felsineum]URZ18549.1 hypothetical protein CLFE_046370 [Clostridium felsineum DSM 794]
MIYPIGFRRNNRYRGPIESIKQTENVNELVININTLYEAFNKLENSASEMQTLAFTNNINELQKFKNSISNLMEVMKYGTFK